MLPARKIKKQLLFFMTLLIVYADNLAVADPSNDDVEFFEARIRPLLVRRCLGCHGGEKTQGGLRVDSRQALMEGGESGPAMMPGQPDASLLMKAVRYQDAALQMPPEGTLPSEEIDLLEQWIHRGASWGVKTDPSAVSLDANHWSFLPLAAVESPADPSGWGTNPVDGFIRRRLDQQGLSPVPLASPQTLMRRVYFDLVGLPPAWHEVEAFVENYSWETYRQLIDRLLESPQYGERWGRHWLDLARYADTQGGSVDCPIPQAHLYRDYVIDSFSADKPYDEFIREQIAGDLMDSEGPPEKVRERLIATGYIGLSLRNGIFKHYHPELIIEDTIDTIGRSILGMTIRCARCHDHKIEPITTVDYYRLYGIFSSSRYPFSGSELPQFSAGESVPYVHPEDWAQVPLQQRQAIEELRLRIKQEVSQHPAQQELREKKARLAGDFARYREIRSQGEFDAGLRTSIDDQDVRIREVIAKLDSSSRGLWNELKKMELQAGVTRLYAMRDENPHDEYVQVGGDPFDVGTLVPRGIPERLSKGTQLRIPDGQSGRLELAEWLTSPDNPLTPRVAVNYVWQFHFGQGIVATADDFGLGGALPTHPELLDWLANDFVAHGWSIKHLHRRIMLSSTYRLSSLLDARSVEIDPANRWHWRCERRRLDAESIRDGMMQIAGTLNRSRPGGHPFPAEESWQFSQHGPFKAIYESPYRSVYLMTQRIQRHPFLALFDGPDTNRTTAQRKVSSKALQALYLQNSSFVHAQAHALAEKLVQSTSDSEERIQQAIQRAWSRAPTEKEIQDSLQYLKQFAAQWQQDTVDLAGGLQTELMLEYKFDGSAQDSSGRQRHGLLHGDPTFVPGKSGQAISFDGEGDYVDSGTTMNDLGNAFVVECWVRPGPEQAHYADIFGNHLGGGRGFVLQQNGNATNQFRGSMGVGGDNWVLSEPVPLQVNMWQKIAFVRTPRSLQLFLNGKKQVEVLSTAVIEPSPFTFHVGLGISAVERSFYGDIDDLRVYRGIPEEYRLEANPQQVELVSWSSYARLLLTANEFLYVD